MLHACLRVAARRWHAPASPVTHAPASLSPQAGSTKRKKGDALRASEAEDIERLEEQTRLLQELHESIYSNIFVLRYRDTLDDIRASCLNA